MKKLIVLLAAGILCTASFAFAQDVDLSALKAQIAEIQSKVDDMSKDMTKMQQHTITDKVSLGIEFMTRLDSIQYDNVRGLPPMASDMMSLWLGDSLAHTEGTTPWDAQMMTPTGPTSGSDGWNDAFMNKYGAQLMQMFADPSTGQIDQQAMGAFTQMLSKRTFKR